MFPPSSLQDMCGVHHEVEPVSVLDFYVHESRQRSGCGRRLFEAMMEVCKCADSAPLVSMVNHSHMVDVVVSFGLIRVKT